MPMRALDPGARRDVQVTLPRGEVLVTTPPFDCTVTGAWLAHDSAAGVRAVAKEVAPAPR